MFGFKHGRLGSAGNRTLIQRAIASLRARGSDAHLWLPGVGTLSGLQTGNYLESTGNTLATVDNPCGLVLDALGTLGVEKMPSSSPSGAGWSTQYNAPATGNQITFAQQYGNTRVLSATTVAGVYKITFKARRISGNTTIKLFLEGGIASENTWPNVLLSDSLAEYSFTLNLAAPCNVGLQDRSASGWGTVEAYDFSVREVTGIHLTQSTTANKGLLKQDAGSRYYWLFDATDLLTGTFPAGYESVTVIDAKSTGQVTTSAANVVGSYSIGPSYSSYGRIIINGSITASELALYQGFANRLAGL